MALKLPLVLQSHLCEELTTEDMCAFGPCLVAATPGRPVQDLGRYGWWLPDEREEQATYFWHSEWQEVQRHYDAVWLGGRPLLRLRCVSCARCAWRRTTVR